MKDVNTGDKVNIKPQVNIKPKVKIKPQEGIKHTENMGPKENLGRRTSLDYVIIGNSAAGVAAAESIRKIDKRGKISIFTDEKYSN
jgi:UDP-3-O-[3-hydroxymyristoyl] glucosamine N-acyltransferase